MVEKWVLLNRNMPLFHLFSGEPSTYEKKKKKKPGESCDNNNKNILWQRLRENLEKLKKKKKKRKNEKDEKEEPALNVQYGGPFGADADLVNY